MSLGHGVLIALDGIDGAGKTTQALALAKALEGWGLVVAQDKEPTNGPEGTRLRESAQTGRLGREEELRLFHEDRRAHVRTFINPCLENGTVVVLDRYYYSTAAYQGLNADNAEELVQFNEGFAPRPDLAVILDITPETAVERLAGRGGQNRFESLEGLRAARGLFLGLQRQEIRVVDGSRSIEAVTTEILDLARPIARARTEAMAEAIITSGAPPEDMAAMLLQRHMR